MRLVFAGTPDFSVAALDALHADGHDIVGVYTQPDRPAGRGRKLQQSAVGAHAATLGLNVLKPEKFNADAINGLRALAPDAMVVVAYGLILPQAVLDIPPRGCFNIHASLLPRWRGAAPIQRAILAGDSETGITIMRMDAGLDTGPMLLRRSMPIGAAQTSGDLQGTLSTLGASMMAEALRDLDALHETAQPSEGATYAKKIRKDEARMDWSQPATELARAVRGYHPAPVAWTELSGERVLVHAARAEDVSRTEAVGTIVAMDSAGLGVNCGEGVLHILEWQRAGGKILPAALAPHAWLGQRFS